MSNQYGQSHENQYGQFHGNYVNAIYESHVHETEFKHLEKRIKMLESIVMQLMKDKSTKDLSEIFNITEKEVRDTKAIVSGM